ncbi:MAG: PhnD/SsuA/transferrin family substrate-binding protein [Rhodobacteraceae bacterium]|nr:PhnD/SsuA/transferrin family substrate-binding protein [Paracoccaceae bacterium]
MIAALPMYDWPEVRDATDAFWAVWRDKLRLRGIDAPERLTRDAPLEEIWTHPELLVAQTCGWPFVRGLCGDARLIATPCYAAEGCEGPMYRSWLVARSEEVTAGRITACRHAEGRRMAVNCLQSLSGWRGIAAELKAGVSVMETGSHRESIRAVAEERADVAAIDVVSWGLACAWAPDLTRRLRVAAGTPPVPGLPFITAGARPEREILEIRAALHEALAAPEAGPARAAMMLKDVSLLSDEDYAPLNKLGSSAELSGRR